MTSVEPLRPIVPTRDSPMFALCVAAVLVSALSWAAPGVWSTVSGRTLGGLAGSPVYSVAAVRASLARDPEAWSGRTVRVRAALTIDPTRAYCPTGPLSCVSNWTPILVDPRRPDPSAGLVLAYGAPDPFWAALRRLSLLRSLVPRPQIMRWGRLATYRVRLQPTSGCRACAVALVLDAQGGA